MDVAPNQPNAHLYLAQALDQKNEHAAAARHWNAFLQLAAAHPDDPTATPAQLDSATLQLADDEARVNHKEAAMAGYLSAIALAERDKNLQLESLALAHLGDYQEKTGDAAGAAHSFQRGLALDANCKTRAVKRSTGSTTDNFSGVAASTWNWPMRAICARKFCWAAKAAKISRQSKLPAAKWKCCSGKRRLPCRKICLNCWRVRKISRRAPFH